MLRQCLLAQAILGHPLALVKLGMFLRDINALRHSYEAKPTIIIGPADAQGDCLIVAVTKEPIGQAGQVCDEAFTHESWPNAHVIVCCHSK